MTTETKDTIREALKQYRGDDYERVSAAFRACTPAQMQEVWSGNGETRQEVLDGYRNHVKRIETALRELEGK